jgi:hypothetical protein
MSGSSISNGGFLCGGGGRLTADGSLLRDDTDALDRSASR